MKKLVVIFIVFLCMFLMTNAQQEFDTTLEAVDIIEEELDEYFVEKNILILKIDNPYALINDEFVLLDDSNTKIMPVIINNRTLVPVRFVSENLGFEVQWNARERTAIMTKDDIIISCKTEASVIDVNGQNVNLDVPSMIINDRLYVPLRAISEIFDNNVSYKDRVIMVTDSDFSIEHYEEIQFANIYSEFVKKQMESQYKKEEGNIPRWEIAKTLVNHIIYFHKLSINHIDFYYFPDGHLIPESTYYHANIAVFLNLLMIKSGDFEPYGNISFSEFEEAILNFEKALKNKPYLSFTYSLSNKEHVLSIIDKHVKNLDKNIRISIYDFATNTSVNYNGFDKFYPASLSKVLNLLCYLKEVEKGNLSLYNTYTLKESDKYVNESMVVGAGNLQFQEEGTQYSYNDILFRMISLSDNVAANIIIDALGYNKINSLSKNYGLKDTMIYRKFYEMNSPVPVNFSTAYDLTKMLVLLENRTILEDGLSNIGIDFMKKTYNKDRIALYAPDNVVIANKIGSLSRLSGDMAIVYFENREPIALTIFVEDKNRKAIDNQEVNHVIGELSKEVIDYYSQFLSPSLYIKGDLIEKNIGLRFIEDRPYMKYHNSLEDYSIESVEIGGEKYISLDSLAQNTKYSYLLTTCPLYSISIR
ncbi:UNVERIFIED_CONTAM: beta-lactamase class A [Acetivibrio alkalicellulosi]